MKESPPPARHRAGASKTPGRGSSTNSAGKGGGSTRAAAARSGQSSGPGRRAAPKQASRVSASTRAGGKSFESSRPLSRTESSSSKDRGGGRSGGSSRLVVDLSRVSVEDDEEDPAWLMKKSVLVEDIERSLSIGQLGASKVESGITAALHRSTPGQGSESDEILDVHDAALTEEEQAALLEASDVTVLRGLLRAGSERDALARTSRDLKAVCKVLEKENAMLRREVQGSREAEEYERKHGRAAALDKELDEAAEETARLRRELDAVRGELLESQRGLSASQRAEGEAKEWRREAAAERRARLEDREEAKVALESEREERDAREARLFAEAAQAKALLEHAAVASGAGTRRTRLLRAGMSALANAAQVPRCMRCQRESGTAVQRMDLRRRSARVRSAWRWWLHLARSMRALVAAAEWMARAKRMSKVGWAMRTWRHWCDKKVWARGLVGRAAHRRISAGRRRGAKALRAWRDFAVAEGRLQKRLAGCRGRRRRRVMKECVATWKRARWAASQAMRAFASWRREGVANILWSWRRECGHDKRSLGDMVAIASNFGGAAANFGHAGATLHDRAPSRGEFGALSTLSSPRFGQGNAGGQGADLVWVCEAIGEARALALCARRLAFNAWRARAVGQRGAEVGRTKWLRDRACARVAVSGWRLVGEWAREKRAFGGAAKALNLTRAFASWAGVISSMSGGEGASAEEAKEVQGASAAGVEGGECSLPSCQRERAVLAGKLEVARLRAKDLEEKQVGGDGMAAAGNAGGVVWEDEMRHREELKKVKGEVAGKLRAAVEMVGPLRAECERLRTRVSELESQGGTMNGDDRGGGGTRKEGKRGQEARRAAQPQRLGDGSKEVLGAREEWWEKDGRQEVESDKERAIGALQQQLLDEYAQGSSGSSCVLEVMSVICEGCNKGEAAVVLCAQAAIGAALAADACRVFVVEEGQLVSYMPDVGAPGRGWQMGQGARTMRTGAAEGLVGATVQAGGKTVIFDNALGDARASERVDAPCVGWDDAISGMRGEMIEVCIPFSDPACPDKTIGVVQAHLGGGREGLAEVWLSHLQRSICPLLALAIVRVRIAVHGKSVVARQGPHVAAAAAAAAASPSEAAVELENSADSLDGTPTPSEVETTPQPRAGAPQYTPLEHPLAALGSLSPSRGHPSSPDPVPSLDPARALDASRPPPPNPGSALRGVYAPAELNMYPGPGKHGGGDKGSKSGAQSSHQDSDESNQDLDHGLDSQDAHQGHYQYEYDGEEDDMYMPREMSSDMSPISPSLGAGDYAPGEDLPDSQTLDPTGGRSGVLALFATSDLDDETTRGASKWEAMALMADQDE